MSCHFYENLHLAPEVRSIVMKDFCGDCPETLDFLAPERICESCAAANIREKQELDRFLETGATINSNPDLRAYLWHIRKTLREQENFFSKWPSPPIVGDMIFAHAAVELYPDARKNYRKLGYPEDMMNETLDSSFASVFRQHTETEGTFGIAGISLTWQRKFLQAELFRFGRLQFKLHVPEDFGVVLKHRGNGEKVVLIGGGKKINSEGFFSQFPSETDWETDFDAGAEGYCGYPASPYGFVIRERNFYSHADWETIVFPGDAVMEMHIPYGGPIPPDAVLDSLQRAHTFFGTFFAEKVKPVFYCFSWILNTDFEKRLPDSNIARLMRQCYLWPAPSSGRDGLFFLFGTRFKPDELDRFPRDTSQRRAMLDILQSGGRLRNGNMFFFAEDLPRYGTEPYRGKGREVLG